MPIRAAGRSLPRYASGSVWTRDLWYKDAVVYCVDVERYADGNGDGVGDFPGLIARLDYIAGLGVNCIWLMPFYPTPNRDNGYDVSEYYGIDPRLGTLGDFVEFVHQARDHGMRVVADLVVNHTSVDHPWFQAARSAPGSPYRDYYVWSKECPEGAGEGMVFPGVQEATWTWDEEAGAYYFHRFYAHEPDLNISNPAVRAEILRVLGFWVALGVSGFRIDAAPFLVEMKGTPLEAQGDAFGYFKELRAFLSFRRGDAILLAEANVVPEKFPEYFGDGDKLHMLFAFILNQRTFLAFAREEAGPIAEALELLRGVPPIGQWAVFLRNHDELDLGRLSEEEREEVFAAFGPEPEMRAYGRGIRRRLAPMLGGDRLRLELAYSLLLSMPGTPVLYYGDEIGMGDDLSLEERESVRTAMQWTAGKNAGFSGATKDAVAIPVVTRGSFSAKKVNAEDARRDPGSLLHWMTRAIHARKQCPEIGRLEFRVLDAGDPSLLALCYGDARRALVLVHNLSSEPRLARVDPGKLGVRRRPGRAHVLLAPAGVAESQPEVDLERFELEGYGYRWLRIGEAF